VCTQKLIRFDPSSMNCRIVRHHCRPLEWWRLSLIRKQLLCKAFLLIATDESFLCIAAPHRRDALKERPEQAKYPIH
jgi:hypothetical protein